jgi:hypothetical protein
MINPLDGSAPPEMHVHDQGHFNKASCYPFVANNSYYDLFEAGSPASYFTRRTGAGGYLQ